MNPIYLDHHSTTPVDPDVLAAMTPYFTHQFGNAASKSHMYGRQAGEAVERARAEVGAIIGATEKDIIFTSGATESINLAIKGVADFYKDKGNHIITASTEHRAVLDCCETLKEKGFKITRLPVDEHGLISTSQLTEAITQDTILISIMFANHEIGTVHDVAAIGQIAKAHGVFFHCDATQAAGKEKIDVEKMGIDLLSLSAHKIYGPKGIGALYVRRKNPRVRLTPLLSGGGHERGYRSGTLNVPGIVGLGKACQIMQEVRSDENRRVRNLREKLKTEIEYALEGVHLNGHPTRRLAGNLNLSFENMDGRALVSRLGQKIAVSSGASCTSAYPEPSYIIKAIGVPAKLAQATLRIGIGRFNTEDEIEIAGDAIIDEVKRLRTSKEPAAICTGF